MASTTLSNVNFQSNVFMDTMVGEFTHRLALLTSGMLLNVDSAIPDSSGHFVTIPKFDTLSGDSVQITDSSTTTINSLGDVADKGVYIEREKAWGADAIIRTVAGKDVTREIARQLGQYWAGEVHRVGIKTLDGVFSTALASTHSTSTSYSSSEINVQAIIGAKRLLGDNMDMLTDIIMNSKVYSDALNEKIVEYDKAQVDSYGSGVVERILGLRTHVTDKVTATSSVYPSYIGTTGSMIYKFRQKESNQFNNANIFNINAGGLKIQVELNREAKTAGGQDELITRASFFTHVPGVAWASATTNPTDAQLATGANWIKVYTDDKQIRLLQVKTL